MFIRKLADNMYVVIDNYLIIAKFNSLKEAIEYISMN
jgi:hypothetical protein